jgi:hypothetical protein
MNIIIDFLNFFRNTNAFTASILLVVLILYNFFALILAFQIFSFNRLLVQEGFSPVFKAIALVHAAISFILLLLVVFAL